MFKVGDRVIAKSGWSCYNFYKDKIHIIELIKVNSDLYPSDTLAVNRYDHNGQWLGWVLAKIDYFSFAYEQFETLEESRLP